jgi:hypothetical protein
VNVPGRTTSGEIVADVALEQRTSDSARLTFSLSDEANHPIRDLQPYLGARGHLVVISADGRQYVHTHPLESDAASEKISFEVHFPGPGLYKAWGQFQRGGNIITIPVVAKF